MQRTFFKFFFCSFIILLPFNGMSQKMEDVRINLQLNDVSLKDAIRSIEAVTPFKFLAKAEDIEQELHIHINASNEPLNKVLDKIFTGRRLEYKQIDQNILIKRVDQKHAPVSQVNANAGTQKYVLHGTIKSEKTGETIIGATIVVNGSSAATISNEYGFYSLTLPQGNYTLLVSAIGMITRKVPVNVNKNLRLDLSMIEDAKSLEVVTVTSTVTARSLKNPQMSVERINVQEIKNLPVLFGERDVLKTIQLLPGVKAAGEGNSGFYVRGGAADQNLILLDEAPVYNASHLLGFFSTFNSDAIKNVTLYKGGMPAQYGGRLSSVVDIKMNDGNNQDFSVSGGIGLIASRLNIEGPIQKDRSSFLVSGRRTYADVFLKVLGDSSLRKTQLYFYDLNAKTNFTLDEKNRLYLSAYFGRDKLSQDKLAGINWGNATSTLRWNHIFNKKLFSNTSLIYSNYDYKINVKTESIDYQIRSWIRDWNLKEELQWYANASNTINMGINAIYHTIKPGEISVTGNTGTVLQGLPDRFSLENALYINNNWRATDRWNLAYGLRVSSFSILGAGDYYTLDAGGEVADTLHYGRGEVVKTYVNPEPRVAASYQLNNTSALKASYTRNTQNLHLISNSTSSSPTDKWIASTNIIKPEIADQVAIGYYKNIKNALYELTIEAYYKKMQNQIDYRNGAEVFSNRPIETQLLFGKGRAYGIEWLFKKKAGKFNGWLSYTLSKTERKIEGINNNDWYNARQDRTHDIAIVGMYQLNKKWTLSANWVFNTGEAITFPSGKYKVDGEVYFYYSERNSYRMPNYHRLDFSATKQLKKGKRFSSELNFSVFNVYGRANAYQIDFQESEDHPDKTEAVKTSLFTFVPSISYNFKF
ncbi:TonB-dependent receptor [Chitinophagaceae bacterium LB-8]|uniref:TonB-dependent receptor n=1 Tax=Paraflavisolibacter caeni TaxID=2982496 RepID=A0A9X2XXQ0_9BACT|nr:TonB-dependent receptor [Paraflavisolibacter caeni]MCU7550681.1 TonB-dependent receptor [Paraflavisolibacter caeni]